MSKEEEVKQAYSYFKTEPLSEDLQEKLAIEQRHHREIPDPELIKRPSQIAGIRERAVIIR